MLTARDFSSAERFKNGGILYVFPIFEAARMKEKICCSAADDLFRDSLEITDRIAHFLDTGEVISVSSVKKKAVSISDIQLDTQIEPDFVCSEKHRAFFKEHIGTAFSFNVAFQNWLKNNTGKSYKEAIAAYYQILEEKKKGETTIDRQFEYNTYIRDFFADNQGKSLEDAIKCWKYKKQLQGHNRYERADLIAIE